MKFDEILLLCDNENAVKIATNHFLRDHVNKGDIKIDGIGTEY